MRQHAVSTVRGLAAAGYCLKAEALRLAAVLAAPLVVLALALLASVPFVFGGAVLAPSRGWAKHAGSSVLVRLPSAS